ncbi:MAG TPA: RecX family transcriptional regulator, partial [Ottowia sp.]|nr:RecX family transcriptional regulator [Ottowia sp.]
EAVVADAARQLQGSEFDRALAVWRRRFAAPPGDAGERARQLRFLAGRGFSAEVAWRVLSAAAQATGPSNGG